MSPDDWVLDAPERAKTEKITAERDAALADAERLAAALERLLYPPFTADGNELAQGMVEVDRNLAITALAAHKKQEGSL